MVLDVPPPVRNAHQRGENKSDEGHGFSRAESATTDEGFSP
jgi:hypothetical protein